MGSLVRGGDPGTVALSSQPLPEACGTVRRVEPEDTTAARASRRRLAWALHGGTVALAAAGAAAHRRLAPRHPRAAAAVVPVGTLAGWAALAVVERRRPFDPAWQQDHDDTGTDALCLPLAAVPLAAGTALGGLVGSRIRLRLGLGRAPGMVAVPVALATYDLFHYAYHRTAHEWGPLWKLHAVHHSPERLYWLNATRFHAGETLIESTVETMLGRMFGLTASQEVAYRLFRGTYGQLQHANVAVDCGPLDRVFSTPELHRWHHSVDYTEGDTNYGAMTSLWDQLLGSWFRPDRPFDSPVGVGRMPRFPRSWVALQRVPWDWDRIKADNADTWVDAARSDQAKSP